jgi:hypothetical protein
MAFISKTNVRNVLSASHMKTETTIECIQLSDNTNTWQIAVTQNEQKYRSIVFTQGDNSPQTNSTSLTLNDVITSCLEQDTHLKVQSTHPLAFEYDLSHDALLALDCILKVKNDEKKEILLTQWLSLAKQQNDMGMQNYVRYAYQDLRDWAVNIEQPVKNGYDIQWESTSFIKDALVAGFKRWSSSLTVRTMQWAVMMTVVGVFISPFWMSLAFTFAITESVALVSHGLSFLWTNNMRQDMNKTHTALFSPPSNLSDVSDASLKDSKTSENVPMASQPKLFDDKIIPGETPIQDIINNTTISQETWQMIEDTAPGLNTAIVMMRTCANKDQQIAMKTALVNLVTRQFSDDLFKPSNDDFQAAYREITDLAQAPANKSIQKKWLGDYGAWTERFGTLLRNLVCNIGDSLGRAAIWAVVSAAVSGMFYVPLMILSTVTIVALNLVNVIAGEYGKAKIYDDVKELSAHVRTNLSDKSQAQHKNVLTPRDDSALTSSLNSVVSSASISHSEETADHSKSSTYNL